MVLGFPWDAVVVVGVVVAGVVMIVARRKREGEANYGQAGAGAVKLGRLDSC